QDTGGDLMPSEPNAPRSRRAILAAAAGSAAALAASAALPLTAAAAPANMQTESDNATSAETSVTQATDAVVAFRAHNVNTGAAALIGSDGDESNMAADTSWTGVYGWSPSAQSDTLASTGVWGDSDDYGMVGTGGIGGVIAFGESGVVGIGDVDGIVGIGGPTGAGVLAVGDSATTIALDVQGKAKFSRSGRNLIGAGKSSLKINLAGTSTASRVFAVLHSNRSGRYVRAVVPTTGSFTIYLNSTVASSTYVAWFVIN
ncbi:MAG TPA: hypothetical protein VFI69_07515, partial [Candidatus Limnocylindrales bacterium]|nr:hypothetical protein [Candidatus Limnocylindrales bacterium]